MADPEQQRTERRTEQLRALFEAIGRCVVEFSQLIHWMRDQLVLTFPVAGAAQSAVHQLAAELTERQVINIMFDRMSEALNDDDKAVVKRLRGLCHRAHDERNRIDHDHWVIGWGNEQTTEFDEAKRVNPKATRPETAHTAESLTATAQQLKDLLESVRFFFGCWFRIAILKERQPGYIALSMTVDEAGRLVRLDGGPTAADP